MPLYDCQFCNRKHKTQEAMENCGNRKLKGTAMSGFPVRLAINSMMQKHQQQNPPKRCAKRPANDSGYSQTKFPMTEQLVISEHGRGQMQQSLNKNWSSKINLNDQSSLLKMGVSLVDQKRTNDESYQQPPPPKPKTPENDKVSEI